MKIHNFDFSFVDPAMLASACRYHRIEGPQLCLSCKYFLWLRRWWTGGFGGGGEREREGTVVVKVASAGLECWTGGLGGSGELVMVAAAEVWACGCCCLGVTAMVTSEVWAPTIAVVAAGLPAEVLKIEED
nr:hypothetical protein Iba_chr13fCG5700 [Ipomoea batatas]